MEPVAPSGHEQMMVDTSDGKLWIRIQADDPVAFGEFFERYARDVYNFVFRRTGAWDLAEEMTSAVFLEAWRRRTDFVPEQSTLRPWLFGVATNLLRNRSRSTRRRRAAEARLRLAWEPDFADDVARRIDDEVLMRQTLRVFERLPVIYQDVVGLAAWEGLSYEEISTALGIPVGTVRSRIHRGRRLLMELLSEGGHQSSEDEPITTYRPRRNPS